MRGCDRHRFGLAVWHCIALLTGGLDLDSPSRESERETVALCARFEDLACQAKAVLQATVAQITPIASRLASSATQLQPRLARSALSVYRLSAIVHLAWKTSARSYGSVLHSTGSCMRGASLVVVHPRSAANACKCLFRRSACHGSWQQRCSQRPYGSVRTSRIAFQSTGVSGGASHRSSCFSLVDLQ